MSSVSVGVSSETAARQLVKDLHRPRPAMYWTDLLLSALVGWSLVILAVYSSSASALFWLGGLGGAFALYRGLCFVHEISHLRQKSIPGLAMVWDLILGVPLLMPSFSYVGVHSNHHSLATYGTEQDPEYLPFARSHRMTMAFIAHSVLIPLALLIRFLVLSPIALLWPRFHDWLVVHGSSLSMNMAYRRDNSPALSATIKRWEAAILLVWIAAGAVTLHYRLAGKILLVWYLVTAFMSLCNTLRTLGAHRYESAGAPLDRPGQLTDSIDTPGALVTELWAPVGLRYHALHHYFPGIPYHNLGLAYRRLVANLPLDAAYRNSASPGLVRSLRSLYLAGKMSHREKFAGRPGAVQPPLRSSGQ